MSENSLKIGGTYEHYKGKRYKVHGLARHSETLEELVYYETLYDSDMGNWWVRPLAMFLESVEVNGETKPRFKLVEE